MNLHQDIWNSLVSLCSNILDKPCNIHLAKILFSSCLEPYNMPITFGKDFSLIVKILSLTTTSPNPTISLGFTRYKSGFLNLDIIDIVG